MKKFLKYHTLYVAIGFILISYIQQFYYAEWRGIFVGWGMLLAFLITYTFDWYEDSKQKKEVGKKG